MSLAGKAFSSEMADLWNRVQVVSARNGHKFVYAIDVLIALTLEPREGGLHACNVLRDHGVTKDNLVKYVAVGRDFEPGNRMPATALESIAGRIKEDTITPENLLVQLLQDQSSSAGIAISQMRVRVSRVIRELARAPVHT